MRRYIDADALKAFIKDQYFQCDMPEEWNNGVMWATSQINHYCNKAPSIDIDRPQGEWIDMGGYEVCKNCHEVKRFPHWNFCPNCGARMKGADDETTTV